MVERFEYRKPPTFGIIKEQIQECIRKIQDWIIKTVNDVDILRIQNQKMNEMQAQFLDLQKENNKLKEGKDLTVTELRQEIAYIKRQLNQGTPDLQTDKR